MKHEKYLVIIGDIVRSRDLKDRKKTQTIFHEYFNTNLALSEMIVFKENIVSNFTVTIGDEFQGVTKSANHIFKFLQDFEYSLKRRIKENINFRYGIGLGTITTKINKEAAIGMDGPAFYNARKSIEVAKENGLKYCFESGFGNDEYINILLHWLGLENKKWNFRKFQIVKLFKDNLKQKQISESLKISQPAISKILKNVPIALTTQTEKIIEHQINSILDKKQVSNYSLVAEPSSKYNSEPR